MRMTNPRKVALLANCLLNQNAKVCQGANYPGVVSPVVEALRSRGYHLQQLPCPELAFAGVRRWWAVYEQYDTPAYRNHCRQLAAAIAPLIESFIRRGDEVILIGLDGSPSTGVRFTSSQPQWGGRPNRPQDDWDIVPGRGIWIEELEMELARRGLPRIPATGWALDMGRFDEAGSRSDLEQFLDARDDVVATEPSGGEHGDDKGAT
jgi:predicted secreted protein